VKFHLLNNVHEHTHKSVNGPLNKENKTCNLHFSNFFYKFFTCHVFHLPNSNNSKLISVYMHIKILISRNQTQDLTDTSRMFIGHWGTVEHRLDNSLNEVPVIVKYMEKNLNTMKSCYSKHIFPVPWPFVKSRFHCMQDS